MMPIVTDRDMGQISTSVVSDVGPILTVVVSNAGRILDPGCRYCGNEQQFKLSIVNATVADTSILDAGKIKFCHSQGE